MIVFSVIFISIAAFYGWWRCAFLLTGTTYEAFGMVLIACVVLPPILIMGGIYGWQLSKNCHKKRQGVNIVLLKLLLASAASIVPAILITIPDGSLLGKNSAMLGEYIIQSLAILLPVYIFAAIYCHKYMAVRNKAQKSTPKW